MIAGNHEQYGEKLWKEFTGHNRKDIYICEDYLFILLDTFGADLDPTIHSDGTYVPADVNFIKEKMDEYKDKKVILCSHYFEPHKETDEFKKLLQSEKRIVCLFAGHTHKNEIWHLEDFFGYKKLIFCGNYSDIPNGNPLDNPWGFRELILEDEKIQSSYITPENIYKYKNEDYYCKYGRKNEITIKI